MLDIETLPAVMDWQDIAALVFFFACWSGYAWYTELRSQSSNTLLAVTNRYRLQWMREMLKRDNRMVDATMVGNLLRSITFFASTSIFILFGLMTMLGYQDRLAAIFARLPFAKPTIGFMWEVKIFLLIIIFIYAFFKCTWSVRQYNYTGIFIAAAPHPKEIADALERTACKGAQLASNAAKHFNDGQRAYYFGLAALSWFVHPYLFMATTASVVYVVQRREYRSATLHALMQE